VTGPGGPPDERLDRRYGRGRWWAPEIALRYGLAGFDARPIAVDHHLTFVLRGGRWVLGADDDFALQGRPTPRAFWDRGPVVAVRGEGVLVLGHPAQRRLLDQVAGLAAASVPRVTAAWGPWDERVVVLVPDDTEELAGLLGSDGDLSRIAAVATAELRGGQGEYDPAGRPRARQPRDVRRAGRRRPQGGAHPRGHPRRDAAGERPGRPGLARRGLRRPRRLHRGRPAAERDRGRPGRRGQGGTGAGGAAADADFEGGSPRLSQAYQGRGSRSGCSTSATGGPRCCASTAPSVPAAACRPPRPSRTRSERSSAPRPRPHRRLARLAVAPARVSRRAPLIALALLLSRSPSPSPCGGAVYPAAGARPAARPRARLHRRADRPRGGHPRRPAAHVVRLARRGLVVVCVLGLTASAPGWWQAVARPLGGAGCGRCPRDARGDRRRPASHPAAAGRAAMTVRGSTACRRRPGGRGRSTSSATCSSTPG
jgi:hypothetical protein